MKIKYVGVKVNGSTAFKSETGITWMQGDVHEVRDAIAARMLRHPDVFALVEVEDQPKPAPISLTPQPSGSTEAATAGGVLAPGAEVKPAGDGGEPPKFVMATKEGGTIVLDEMEKAALHALAKESGVKVHHAAGAETVRKALVEAFPVAQ